MKIPPPLLYKTLFYVCNSYYAVTSIAVTLIIKLYISRFTTIEWARGDFVFITFRKWTILYVLSLIALVISFALITRQGEAVQTSAEASYTHETPILIIDPGHGGEDGGAVSADGTIESHINLAISLTTSDLARLLGWDVYMTRQDDISIHDSSAQTLREKKVSDLNNRAKLCNSIENGILISIHQNSIPSAKSVRGAQVFYNQISESVELAQTAQEIFNETINLDHKKSAKSIGDSSYLMKSVQIPAILVECGFLSNDSETQLLKSAEYQLKIALCIIGSIHTHTTAKQK